MAKTLQEDRESEEPEPSFLRLSVTNQIHIDVDNLVAILRRYEADRSGFPRRIPRLR